METNEGKVTATECPCARSVCELYVIASEDGLTAWQKEDAEKYANAINSLPALLQVVEAARILRANAVLIPDPRMENKTDCYAATLDDIDALDAALAAVEGRGRDES